MKQPKTGVIYRGPSLLDGKPIVAIATYTASNRKTGAMLQTYILREDIAPLAASKSGEDESICGDCPMRGVVTDDPARSMAKDRGCYVRIEQGPTIVWKALHRGAYPYVTLMSDVTELGRGRMVRLGTYGDPAAVPTVVWQKLTERAAGWTGYTHQWRDAPASLKSLCMASVENPIAAAQAHRRGWRTFRVRMSTPDVSLVRYNGVSEVTCPASKEAGARTQCADCLLCMGTKSKSPKHIVIQEH